MADHIGNPLRVGTPWARRILLAATISIAAVIF
jgi:hypothetical protein